MGVGVGVGWVGWGGREDAGAVRADGLVRTPCSKGGGVEVTTLSRQNLSTFDHHRTGGYQVWVEEVYGSRRSYFELSCTWSSRG